MTIFEGDIYMKLEDAKILIGDDSILCEKTVKRRFDYIWRQIFFEAANGQEAIENLKLKNRISYS